VSRQVQWLTRATTEASPTTIEHVMGFTGQNVNLSGVHGDAIKCAGAIIGFPCVDIHGKQQIISCPDTGSFSTANRHCLLPVSRLMHHGFKFNHAILADADQHRFGKYEDYGGTITTPDGITIVMVHHEHTWRLPPFALPETSSKGFVCLPCDPNDIFSSHYSNNPLAVLSCLDPEKACPEEATTNANMGSATEILASFADLVNLAYQSVRPEQRSTITLIEFRRLLEAEHNVSKPTLMQHRQQVKALFQQLVMQSAGASYVQPQAGDETHREYLEILYEKEAMQLHCAFGHCSKKKLLLPLEKHNIPHRHLRKHISRLTCQACLLSLGHRQFRTMQSTVSSSKQLAVHSSDLPGNRSKFEISTLVPSADATSISAALFGDLLASKNADTPISILSFPTQAKLSHARVKQKQAALNTLNRSAADDPGIVKLKAYTQELDEFIEMAEAIDTQPSENILTLQQAHEPRADWADAASLAWYGSRYYLMVEKNTE